MQNNKLLIGFTEEENQTASAHLQKLLPHLKPSKFIFVGGIAIRHHLNKAGIEYSLHPFNDIDLIIEDESAIMPSFKKDFLVMHYHPTDHPWFFISLIDPENKVKDHFFDFEMEPEKITIVRFNNYSVHLVSIEDQLVKLAWDISRISIDSKVEPKQFKETELMLKITNLKKASAIWKRKQFKNRPSSLEKALDYAFNTAKNNPDLLDENLHKKPKPFKCDSCVETEKFPIEDMKNIYKIMNYGLK